jgi:hypothetical protein
MRYPRGSWLHFRKVFLDGLNEVRFDVDITKRFVFLSVKLKDTTYGARRWTAVNAEQTQKIAADLRQAVEEQYRFLCPEES